MTQRKKTQAVDFEISTFNLGWFVGILEGEGSISCRYNTKSGYLCAELTVSSTDEDVINRLHDIYPGKSKYVRKYENHFKTQYVWAVTSRQGIRSVVAKVKDYLSIRRYNQVCTVLAEFDKYETKKP